MKLQVRGYRLPTHPLKSIFTQVHSQEQNSGFYQAVISSPNMHGKRSNRRVIFKRFASVLTCWKRLIFLATAGGMSCSHWELRWNGIHKSELSSWRVLHKFGKVFYENKQKHGLNLYLYPWMYVETKHKSKDLVRYDQTMVSCLYGVVLILGDWQLRWYHAIAGCFVNIWYRVAFISCGNQSWFTVAILSQLVFFYLSIELAPLFSPIRCKAQAGLISVWRDFQLFKFFTMSLFWIPIGSLDFVLGVLAILILRYSNENL